MIASVDLAEPAGELFEADYLRLRVDNGDSYLPDTQVRLSLIEEEPCGEPEPLCDPNAVIDDGNPCTIDSCDPATGEVTHTPAPAGTQCTRDICTENSLCDGASNCTGGTPINVDDGNPCTVDRCDPVAGVTHAPPPGQLQTSTGCITPPSINASLSTSVVGAMQWYYSGPNALQTGLTGAGVEAQRASAVNGRVTDRNGAPLVGVRVSAPNQPQIGSTLTRTDGQFDIVVNGGAAVAL